MTQTISEMKTDHKYWLHELDQWQYSATRWEGQRQMLIDEYKQVAERVRKHSIAIKDFQDRIETLTHEITAAERLMSAQRTHDLPDPQLEKLHASSQKRRNELIALRDKVQQDHHELLTALSVITHVPMREEM